jgi:hypothetical protein
VLLTGLCHQCLPAALHSQQLPRYLAACKSLGPPAVLLLLPPRSQETCMQPREEDLFQQQPAAFLFIKLTLAERVAALYILPSPAGNQGIQACQRPFKSL